MEENKKITLHPLKSDGTPDTNINFYPKTNNIVNDEGKPVDIATKEDIPTNYVTTDTKQIIGSPKSFMAGITVGNLFSDSMSLTQDPNNEDVTAITWISGSSINPYEIKLNGGSQKFDSSGIYSNGGGLMFADGYIYLKNGNNNFNFPSKSGILALKSDIDDLKNYDVTINSNWWFLGNAFFYNADIANLYTSKINPNSEGYGLSLPDTSSFDADETIATTDDIPTNYVTIDTEQEITERKTFVNQTVLPDIVIESTNSISSDAMSLMRVTEKNGEVISGEQATITAGTIDLNSMGAARPKVLLTWVNNDNEYQFSLGFNENDHKAQVLYQSYALEIPEKSGIIAVIDSNNSITIGNTTLTENQLQKLLALLDVLEAKDIQEEE